MTDTMSDPPPLEPTGPRLKRENETPEERAQRREKMRPQGRPKTNAVWEIMMRHALECAAHLIFLALQNKKRTNPARRMQGNLLPPRESAADDGR